MRPVAVSTAATCVTPTSKSAGDIVLNWSAFGKIRARESALPVDSNPRIETNW